jgi:hypothetical protein
MKIDQNYLNFKRRRNTSSIKKTEHAKIGNLIAFVAYFRMEIRLRIKDQITRTFTNRDECMTRMYYFTE